jgi:hypothetical protein
VLPWRDVNENVMQQDQANKDCYWSRSDLKDDFVNQVLPVMVIDDMECLSSGCRNDDCLKFGVSVLDVDFLPKIDVEYLGKTSKANDDPQKDVMIRKSTRLKKLPINKYQDVLW